MCGFSVLCVHKNSGDKMVNVISKPRATDHALEPQVANILALRAFLEDPRSVGVDSLKESLRNIIVLMEELKGANYGRSAEHFSNGEHESMSINDAKLTPSKKRKIQQQYSDDLLKLEEQIAKSFSSVHLHVERKLKNVKENINAEIAKLDEQIEDMASNDEHAEHLKANSKKRRKLKLFKRRVQNYETELSIAAEARDTRALVEVEQNLHQDFVAFNDGGLFPPEQRAPNILDIIPAAAIIKPDPTMRWTRPSAAASPLADILNKPKSARIKTRRSDDTGSASGSGSGGDTDTGGSASDDIEPPPAMDV